MPPRLTRPTAEPTPDEGAAEARRRLDEEIAAATRDRPAPPRPADQVGVTTFDEPGSEDGALTVLLAKDCLHRAPSQSLVRVRSKDGRAYLGVVTAGPFAEPDGLRADSGVLVAVATRGLDYLPGYHGRVRVTLLGEELADGSLAPPRWRPLPHSPVHVLGPREAERVLRAEGDLRLGLAVGHEGVAVALPTRDKAVLPRHTAVLGTTGSGKSTTVAGLVKQAQAAGLAVVLLDVEGEYTRLHEPTDDPRMLAALAERGLAAEGLPAGSMTLYHLAGRDTANPAHPERVTFSLQFARLSPYAVIEILELSDAMQERFLKAYDVCKEVLRDLGIFPAKGDAAQEQLALEIDEMERGWPRLTLSLLLDVAGACLAHVDRAGRERARQGGEEAEGPAAFEPYNEVLKSPEGRASLRKRVAAAQLPGVPVSWRALLGRLWRLRRLRVFDRDDRGAGPLVYRRLLRPGRVSVLDLSDTGYSELNNLIIADLLTGLQEAQDELYAAYESGRSEAPPRALIVIEEAHEFLAEERIDQMPVLFRQVARIAKRGRKRWLGLVFVTQLPAHLPRQVLGLVNGFVLHKINDPHVVAHLRRSVGGVDEGLWSRLPNLAPGQAVVSFPHLSRPLLVSVDPSPCKLRLAD
jgi:DNA helicase HerA-like ATPase